MRKLIRLAQLNRVVSLLCTLDQMCVFESWSSLPFQHDSHIYSYDCDQMQCCSFEAVVLQQNTSFTGVLLLMPAQCKISLQSLFFGCASNRFAWNFGFGKGFVVMITITCYRDTKTILQAHHLSWRTTLNWFRKKINAVHTASHSKTHHINSAK